MESVNPKIRFVPWSGLRKVVLREIMESHVLV